MRKFKAFLFHDNKIIYETEDNDQGGFDLPKYIPRGAYLLGQYATGAEHWYIYDLERGARYFNKAPRGWKAGWIYSNENHLPNWVKTLHLLVC